MAGVHQDAGKYTTGKKQTLLTCPENLTIEKLPRNALLPTDTLKAKLLIKYIMFSPNCTVEKLF